VAASSGSTAMKHSSPGRGAGRLSRWIGDRARPGTERRRSNDYNGPITVDSARRRYGRGQVTLRAKIRTVEGSRIGGLRPPRPRERGQTRALVSKMMPPFEGGPATAFGLQIVRRDTPLRDDGARLDRRQRLARIRDGKQCYGSSPGRPELAGRAAGRERRCPNSRRDCVVGVGHQGRRRRGDGLGGRIAAVWGRPRPAKPVPHRRPQPRRGRRLRRAGPKTASSSRRRLLGEPALERYQPLHAAHAELLRRAATCRARPRLEQAIATSKNAVERRRARARHATAWPAADRVGGGTAEQGGGLSDYQRRGPMGAIRTTTPEGFGHARVRRRPGGEGPCEPTRPGHAVIWGARSTASDGPPMYGRGGRPTTAPGRAAIAAIGGGGQVFCNRMAPGTVHATVTEFAVQNNQGLIARSSVTTTGTLKRAGRCRRSHRSASSAAMSRPTA